jgi:hypothetical protein
LRQHKRGRPSNYNSEVAWAICDRLVDGESLRRICSDAGMPGKATVFRWIARHKEFRDRYICEAKFGLLYRYDGNLFHPEVLVGVPQALVEFHQRRGAFQAVPGTPLHQLWQTRNVVHTADDAGGPSALARLGGARSHLAVPMFKDDALVGSIIIYRQEVRPFTDRQIELVRNFAAQAVIAIENARLLNELRRRTDDLSESLQQQTATSQVLQVISTSPGDLEPVFQAMLENATRICEAKFGNLLLYEGELVRVAAMHGAPPAWEELRRRDPLLPAAGKHPLARVVATRQGAAHCRLQAGGRLPRGRAGAGGTHRSGRRPHRTGGANAQAGRTRRRNCHLPPGGTAIHRQADRIGAEFRQSGRDRDRQHPAAQRTARIATAADCHRRRAQGHQPLHFRSQSSAQHAGRIGCAPLRSGPGRYRSSERRSLLF